jgi:hypothetical protein
LLLVKVFSHPLSKLSKICELASLTDKKSYQPTKLTSSTTWHISARILAFKEVQLAEDKHTTLQLELVRDSARIEKSKLSTEFKPSTVSEILSALKLYQVGKRQQQGEKMTSAGKT